MTRFHWRIWIKPLKTLVNRAERFHFPLVPPICLEVIPTEARRKKNPHVAGWAESLVKDYSPIPPSAGSIAVAFVWVVRCEYRLVMSSLR